jgi:hypothetical protein
MKVSSRGRNEMAVNAAEKTNLGEREPRIEKMTPRQLGNHIRRWAISETSYYYLCGHAVIDERSEYAATEEAHMIE